MNENLFKEHFCSLCSYKTTKEVYLKRHITRVHSVTNIQKVKCKMCPSFFRKDYMGAHLRRVHLKEKSCVCICGVSFFSLSELDRHVQRHHRTDVCLLCDAPVSTLEEEAAHIKKAHPSFKRVGFKKWIYTGIIIHGVRRHSC